MDKATIIIIYLVVVAMLIGLVVIAYRINQLVGYVS